MTGTVNRAVFNQLSYGLYIVTSIHGSNTNGQIVNTILQVTSDPARVAVIINKNNLTHVYIQQRGLFGASILDESATLKFIGLFGFRSGREIDKLSQVENASGATGLPLVLEHTLSTLEARVINQIDVGTHTLFVGDVLSTNVIRSGNPMTYMYYQTNLKGKSSKNSPTFNVAQQL